MIDTSLTSSNFYFLLAVLQGFILAFIIILRGRVSKTNIFFGLLIFLFSLSLLHLILEESISGFNAKFPIPMEFSFAFGPLAYFHILYIKNPRKIFQTKDLLHFLPSLLLDGVFFSAFFLYIGANLDWAYDNIILIQSLGLIMSLLGAVQLGIYTYFMYRESMEAKRLLQEFQKIRKWLNYLMGSWVFLIGFLMLAIPVGLLFIEKVDENAALFYKPLGTFIGLLIYFLGYLYLLNYAKIIEGYTARVAKFGFSAEELENMKAQIIEALAEEELFKDNDLSLAKLASHLRWPVNSLSSVINEAFNTNFNDLINHFRVTAFKAQVLEPASKKYSLVGLGKEVGFRSKSSFYRAFKKETGMTPSEYIKVRA